MYTYNKEMEEKLRAELRNYYNAGISFLPGDILSSEIPDDIPHNFAASFEDSLIQLFSFAVSTLDGNCFPCMINDTEERNAFAEKRHDVPIVGLHLPLVAECICLSQSFAMFDDFFVMDRPITRYDYEYTSPEIHEDGNFDIHTATSESKMTFGNMIAFLAVKFIILHEIGHHNFNHLEKTKSGRLSAKSDGNAVLDGVSLQRLEMEADTWAAAKLIADFSDVKESFNEHFSEEISNLDTIKILYLSALIPLLTAYEKITPDNMLDVDHPPSFIRYNDVKEVFIGLFGINESVNNELWNLVKDEMLQDYEKYEYMTAEFIEVLEKTNVPWQGIDVIAKVKADDADYVRYFVMNWINNIFAYVILRFVEMTGEGFRNTTKRFEDFIAKINELAAGGTNLYNEFILEA